MDVGAQSRENALQSGNVQFSLGDSDDNLGKDSTLEKTLLVVRGSVRVGMMRMGMRMVRMRAGRLVIAMFREVRMREFGKLLSIFVMGLFVMLLEPTVLARRLIWIDGRLVGICLSCSQSYLLLTKTPTP